MKQGLDDLQASVNWRGIDLLVSVRDWEWDGDEWIATDGDVEVDYQIIGDHPNPADEAMRLVIAMIADENQRYWTKITNDLSIQAELNRAVERYQALVENWAIGLSDMGVEKWHY